MRTGQSAFLKMNRKGRNKDRWKREIRSVGKITSRCRKCDYFGMQKRAKVVVECIISHRMRGNMKRKDRESEEDSHRVSGAGDCDV
ncbi:hypothetical protein NPIL_679191 [Nephila pilipes]|uniref:Uncharacterized protein n=1 Tax=Nephila pilipes TaxID=299642 RepID=A0A8X6TIN4_NEPPI|nr:hypothetical protein NPIL_679191 [Nephila pilipes]